MRGAIAIALAVALKSGPTFGGIEPADVVFAGGRVYTVNENQPSAEVLATMDGKFTYRAPREPKGQVRAGRHEASMAFERHFCCGGH